ncbi:MAG: hypothetical protein ACLFN8_03965 [Candidatus Woesearchaeota archaeon]
MKKALFIISLLLLITITPALAQVQGPGIPFLQGDWSEAVGGVLKNVTNILSFSWIKTGDDLKPFLKALFWVLVFTVIYVAGRVAFSAHQSTSGANANKIAIVIAFVFASASTVLVPGEMLVAMFTAYASVIIFIAIGAVIFAVIKIIYGDWLKTHLSGASLHFTRAFGLVLCWWILSTIHQASLTLLNTKATNASVLLLAVFSKDAFKLFLSIFKKNKDKDVNNIKNIRMVD